MPDELLAHAAVLREIRNYGVHPRETRDDLERWFTEDACSLLILRTHHYLTRLAGAVEVTGADPAQSLAEGLGCLSLYPGSPWGSGDPTRGKKTLEAFYSEWVDRAHRTGRPVERTLIEWDQLWRQYIAPKLESTQLRRITRAGVEELLKHPAETSAQRHNDTLKVIRRLLAAAVQTGEIRQNPASGIAMMAIDQDEPWILSADKVDQIMEILPDRFKVMTLLSAYGTLRWSELIALTLREMDLMRNRVRVHDTLVESGTLLEGHGKTKRARRWVTLPADLSLIVSKHIANFPSNENELVFTAEHGGPIRRPAFGRLVWRPAVAKAGLAGFPFRNLRHTGAVMALEAGVSPVLVAFRMGHSSTRMIEKHYSRLLEPMDAEIARLISDKNRTERSESSATDGNRSG